MANKKITLTRTELKQINGGISLQDNCGWVCCSCEGFCNETVEWLPWYCKFTDATADIAANCTPAGSGPSGHCFYC